MNDMFSGLESLGLSNLNKINIYEEEKVAEKKEEKAIIAETEEEMLFDKTQVCAVCEKKFYSKAVKSGKAKLIETDTDLRPKYSNVDPGKYDVIACPHCGYSAISRFFKGITSPQRKLIRENISSQFKELPTTGMTYTYDESIMLHKLALANSVVKKARVSERAYTCLKTAWLIRGKRESLDPAMENYAAESAKLQAEEDGFIKNAYEGFVNAMQTENFPICGMEEMTFLYVTADLARRSGEKEQAIKILGTVITSRNTHAKLKDKARELKDIMLEERKTDNNK